MTMALCAVAVTLGVLVAMEMRRVAAIRYLERAERLRIRFSDLRHRLVMEAGRGRLDQKDRRAFEFLYDAITLILRHPAYYRGMTTAFCAAMLDPKYESPPPRLRKRDFTSRTRPYLKEYVKASDVLMQEFAHSLIAFAAYMSGQSVVEWIRSVRHAGELRREVEAERRRLRQWREAGANVLDRRAAA